jgi:uncharacterized protein (UPF0332 family)
MPINAYDFIRVAKSGIAERNDEPSYRNAVSRAYYSIYHSASSLVLSKRIPKYNGKETPYVKGGTHCKLAYYLTDQENNKEQFDRDDMSVIAVKLKMTKTLRTTADYYLNRTVTAEDADYMIMQAEGILEKVEEMHKSKEVA